MEFVRGDTFSFKFKLKTLDNNILTKSDIETLFITVRKWPSKESSISIQKTLDNVEIDEEGYCHARFESSDTENLNYGFYYFDIEVTLKSGYRKSKLFKFELTKETTIHESGEENGT